ncbi:class I SAM-dependent methyltransferase [Desulfosediminicola flagellatus]|uniref:class I SAM-dependent methyltransferase n=1 Tax=Desulfosediminicola flagellatus TaxID=2569541 RepID=UPI0010ACCD8A|nr:hypothetical protein [Desulfosediminicola flagellatus]
MSVNLKKYLHNLLSQEELGLLVRSYDVIGDIAVIIIPPELESKENVIGQAILDNTKNIKVVAKRDGIYGGEFRTIPLKVIAGENRKDTEHKEYSVQLLVNPEEVYFSVRSGTERKRIASLVEPGEVVLVMFSGIGPYPLVISKNSQAKAIVGVEKNPIAHSYALKSLARNKRIKNVRFYNGDVEAILPALNRLFDRVVMPLPKGGELFLPKALQVLKPHGMLHYYEMQNEECFDDSIAKVAAVCRQQSRDLISAEVVKAGHCAPRTYRICIDCVII